MKTLKEILSITEEITDITNKILYTYYWVKDNQIKGDIERKKGNFKTSLSYSKKVSKLLSEIEELKAKQGIMIINALSN